jgi:hypothetical protein
VLRDAKKLIVLLQHAPLNREHLETAVRDHAVTLTTAKKYGHAIKFLQLATQLAKEPEFKKIDRTRTSSKHLATPELAAQEQAKVLLEQASANAAGSDAAKVQVALDGPVIKFAANLVVTGTQVLLPTADNEQWLGVALKSVELSLPGHASYLFQGTPRATAYRMVPLPFIRPSCAALCEVQGRPSFPLDRPAGPMPSPVVPLGPMPSLCYLCNTHDAHVALGLDTPTHPLAANCHSYFRH